jgi:hypothetical protein
MSFRVPCGEVRAKSLGGIPKGISKIYNLRKAVGFST